MTIRNNKLNFADKSCRIIHGEKITFRVILTYWPDKLPYVLKKILKFLRDLIFSLEKQIYHPHINIWEEVIFLSFVSL